MNMATGKHSPFTIHGRKADIPEGSRKGSLIDHRGRNTFNVDGAEVTFPKGTFYNDGYISITSTPSEKISHTGVFRRERYRAG